MNLNANNSTWNLSENLQDIYDTVARHLLTQGRPATNVLTVCCFRAPDGTSCAIGCLIPNELYKPELELRWGPYALADIGLLPREEVEKQFSSRVLLLCKLQEVHDTAVEWKPEDVIKNWKKALSRVAKQFNLRPFTSSMLTNKQTTIN